MTAVEFGSFFYTSSEIDGSGFGIAASPDSPAFDSAELRDQVQRLAHYTAPFDTPDNQDVADYPVAYRSIAEGPWRLAARVQYVGKEYFRDGFGNRPGNFFAHILVQTCAEPTHDAPSLTALAAGTGWRHGLEPLEQRSTTELKLPLTFLKATAAEILPLDARNVSTLAGLLARIAGGPPVHLEATHWRDALDIFKCLESRLTPAIACELSWSTYESDASRGFDLFASTGETRLRSNPPLSFSAEEDDPNGLFLEAAKHLAGAKGIESVRAFWEQLALVSDCRSYRLDARTEVQNRAITDGLVLLARLRTIETTDRNGRFELLQMGLDHFESMPKTDKRYALLNHLFDSCMDNQTDISAETFETLVNARRRIDQWMRHEPNFAVLESAASKLFLEPALAHEHGIAALETRFKADSENSTWLRACLRREFMRELDWRLRDTDFQTQERLLTLGVMLEADIEPLWKALLGYHVRQCLADEPSAAGQLARHCQEGYALGLETEDVFATASEIVGEQRMERLEASSCFVKGMSRALEQRLGTAWSYPDAVIAEINPLYARPSAQPLVVALLQRRLLELPITDATRWLDHIEATKTAATVLNEDQCKGLLQALVQSRREAGYDPAREHYDLLLRYKNSELFLGFFDDAGAALAFLQWLDEGIDSALSKTLKPEHGIAALQGAAQLTDERVLAVSNFICLQVAYDLAGHNPNLGKALRELQAVHESANGEIYQQCLDPVVSLLFQEMSVSKLQPQQLLKVLRMLVRADVEPHLQDAFGGQLRRCIRRHPGDIEKLALGLLGSSGAQTHTDPFTDISRIQLGKAAARLNDVEWSHLIQGLRESDVPAIKSLVEEAERRRNRRPLMVAKSLLRRIKRLRNKDD